MLLLGRHAPVLQNLHPESLRRQLDIQNRTNAAPPRILQTRQLALARFLRNLTLAVHLVPSLFCVCKFLLQSAEDIFQLRVSNQPGILAALFQQGQVLVAFGKMRARCVCLLQCLAPLI